DDMKNRSGLTAYLDKINKISNDEKHNNKKIASDDNKVIDKKITMIPIVFSKCPKIQQTAANHIKTTRGNLPVPAIIEKIKSIHHNDVSDANDWEDDKLIKQISRMNLEEKSKNGITEQDYNNLGMADDSNDMEIDPSNTDAFHALNPVKL